MRKILAMANIIAVIAIIVFMIKPFQTSPPTAIVTAGEVAIPTTQGSYCWDGLFSGHCVDKAYGSIVAMGEEYKPTAVSPGEKIKVTFNKKPKKVEAEQWIGEEQVKRVELKNHTIMVPDRKGIYMYHLVAHWKQGDGSYAFSVEVR
ncbi:hypothetical protein NQ095_13205 [Rossellomorea sp. SC111]|uniref:hypothetical protein n=1 Tax=Rossellomorea sp. SC111 TaxID=2968985 RepID=UPI00215B59BD|nr:hypothetical protein [Rossellomorea sp. SC111]MCR8849373.1 hypothetical protein [Rossellomorea sp. SC111]